MSFSEAPSHSRSVEWRVCGGGSGGAPDSSTLCFRPRPRTGSPAPFLSANPETLCPMPGVENSPVASGLRQNHVHPQRGQFMQKLKYLLKLLPIPEVVGGSLDCSGHQAPSKLSPWAPRKLARKSSFFPHFSYIFLFFFLDDRILVPTSAPDFHGIIREPWELETSSPGALGDLL